MTEEVVNEVINAASEVAEIEEMREDRKLKRTLVKCVTFTTMFIIIVSFLSLIYAAVIQDKDLNTTFIGDVFKHLFDFLRFLLE